MLTSALRVLVFAALAAPPPALLGEPPCAAAVVFRSGSAAYDDAVNGIRAALADFPCHIQYVDLASQPGENWPAAGRAAPPKLVAAVGLGVYERLLADGSRFNLLPVLVLRSDLKIVSPRAAAIYADVPLVTILERMHELFPKKSRVGLIRRPTWPAPDAAAKDRIRQMGYELIVVECSGPDKLLATFASLKGKVDLVIAPPDTDLFNSATVKPLVLASLDQRLPIVGFSAAFVRAGALAGVYPDFFDAGRRTGELIAQILAGKSQGAEEDVRKVKVAVNQQIARLLGVEAARQDGVEILK